MCLCPFFPFPSSLSPWHTGMCCTGRYEHMDGSFIWVSFHKRVFVYSRHRKTAVMMSHHLICEHLESCSRCNVP